MASFELPEFVGNGILKDHMDTLLADGWDDVPTLKMMSPDDMDLLHLTQLQRDALELRIYLHDRSLMQYADKLEASGRNLPELLNTQPSVLTSEYGMKRGHVARFVDRASACGIEMPSTLSLPARKRTLAHQGMHMTYNKNNNNNDGKSSSIIKSGFQDPVVLRKIAGAPTARKGIYSAGPTNSAHCCAMPSPYLGPEEVTPLSVLEKIMIQKLTPEHKNGNNPFKASQPIKLPPPSKASELWANQPTLILCLRRPGCVMCRSEAHQLYARKPIFDAMGIQLVVCLNEHIDAEVRAFWPRYWGGIVVEDEKREFFKALGGGRLNEENVFRGFLFNATTRANWKRARATGIDNSSTGEASIKGGLYIIRAGNGGVAYQFVERNFGDWAPLEEVLNVCGEIQQ
ncbi:unnamed protein product [Sphagnum jensenii]|uniref:Peroxiredoxin-like 2A n=1 Tax=Sphagnum jensenii TaxID=128206 RepID=A0ABP0VS48_9BRYO